MSPENKRIVFGFLALQALVIVIALQKDDPSPTPSAPTTPSISIQPPAPTSSAVTAERATDPTPEEIRSTHVLRQLIQTHPDSEMRESLSHLISSGEVNLNFQDEPGSGTVSIARVLYGTVPEKGTVLFFSFNQTELLNDKISSVFKQLVIYHEWNHIKQQREGRCPKSIYYSRPPGVPLTADFLQKYLEAEFEAYTAECRLAERIKALDLFAPCHTLLERGDLAFREKIAGMYDTVREFAPYHDTLARIARHQAE